MSKPFHVIATPDETVIPLPFLKTRISLPAARMLTTLYRQRRQQGNRTNRTGMKKTAVCPKCGKTYTGYPAMSRADNKTEICPECGTREALDAAGVDKQEQDIIIAEIQKAAAGV